MAHTFELLFLPVLAVFTVSGVTALEEAGRTALTDARPRRTEPALRSDEATSRGPARLRGLARAPGPSSSLALGRRGDATLAFVADEDTSAILVFDLPEPPAPSPRLRPLSSSPTPGPRHVSTRSMYGRPASILVTPDGRVVVALRALSELAIYEMNDDGSLTRSAAIKTCTEPVGLALSADASRVAVACAWGSEVAEVSLTAARVLARVAVAREPRAVAYDDVANVAYATHAISGKVSIVDFARGVATTRSITPDPRPTLARPDIFPSGLHWSFRDAELRAASNELGPFRRQRDLPAVALSQGFTFALLPGRQTRGEGASSNARLVLPELAVQTNEAAARRVRTSGYGGATIERLPSTESEIAFVDPNATGAVSAVATRLGGHPASCRLPRASVLDDRSGVYFVACLDRPHVTSFAVGGERITPMATLHVADGPTGLAFIPDDERLVVWSSFDRVLTTIEMRGGSVAHAPSPVTFGSDIVAARAPTPFEVGRKLFHATDHPGISGDGRACATCHPDGRDDGLVWSSPEGPRQTPMLAGRLATSSPFGWNGTSRTVREHLAQTVERLGGAGLTDPEVYALLTYLEQMPPPPKARPRAIAREGAAIFRSASTGCATCHDPDRHFTDGETHDVASGTLADRTAALDTPSLRFVGRTAPYFHDGRYATLDALLVDVDGKMGHTGHLSTREREALAAYLESL